MASVLFEFTQNVLRNYLRQGHNFKTADDAIEKISDELDEMLISKGVNVANL